MKLDRRVRWTGLVCGLAVVALGLWWVLTSTLIPLQLDATVVRAAYQSGTSGRTRELQLADGRSLTVDHTLIKRGGGMDSWRRVTVSKSAWQRQLRVDGRVVPLRLSADEWRVLAAVAVLVGCGWWGRRCWCSSE